MGKKKVAQSCREERERGVWTALFGFVKARPEAYASECNGCVITSAQAELLRLMDPAKPEPMSGLAAALGCHASNVTGLVDRLEEQGLVTRQPSAEDRRVKNILLTDEGLEAQKVLSSKLFAPPPELGRLSDEELVQLEGLLRKIEVG